MATYKYGDSAEGSSGLTGHYRRSYAVSDINSKVRSNIPKHSKINSVKYSFDAYQTISLGSTKADGKIGIGSDWNNLAVTIAGGEENIPKNSWTTVSHSSTVHNITSGATTGQFKSNYSSHSVHFFLQSTVVRTMKLRNTYITFDYTPPTYTIALSANNDNYGTVSGSGTWDVDIASKFITITATPKSGYYFVKWSDGNTDASRSIAISQNTITAHNTTLSLTAEFAPNRYFIDLNATPTEGGIVIGGGGFDYLASTTILAIPNEGYKFKQWNDGNTEAERTITISGDATYTAEFEKLNYTATFKNYDGTVLQTVTTEHGTTPSYTGSTPTKPSTAQYNYSFSGWSPTVEAITSDVEYTAQFSSTLRKYTVTWKNYDGTVLETDSTEYGRVPTYDGATPVREADAENSYTFAGWHITVSEVKSDIEYIATYTAVPLAYTVTWKNYDGTVLEVDEKVPYGSMPSYDGNIPTREPTAKYTYLFAEWDTKVVEVTKDVVYTAVFNTVVNEYTITTKSSENGTVTGGGTYEHGAWVTITAIPNEGYEFVRWNDGITQNPMTFPVTGNATYSAIFRLNSIYVGTYRPKSVYTDGESLVLVFSREILQGVSVHDTVDDIHIVLSNTVPNNMTEVDELYIGTTKIYETAN